MTKEEEKKVELLLKQFYPNASQLSDKNRILAWEMALETYKYEDIKQAVIKHATESRYFPYISELTKNIKVEENEERIIDDWREKMAWVTGFLEHANDKKPK